MATHKIEVLGPGCRNCVALDKLTHDAVATLGLDAEIHKVEDYAQIAAYNIMSTPGLVVDGTVILSGRVPKATELQELLSQAAKQPTQLLAVVDVDSCCEGGACSINGQACSSDGSCAPGSCC